MCPIIAFFGGCRTPEDLGGITTLKEEC